MVVGNDANPDPEDVYKQSLLEAWGYTVQMINDGAAQADYDAGISNHDVVYISETIDATTLGSKLGNPSIGIVNEEGWKNDDLGFESANSSNWPVGDSIGITDTSHYITALFPTGPLTIYDADMGGLAIDSTPAPDLQSLADWGSDTGLAVLDTGAMTAGGSPTAGRRVMLPFGRDINMDWPHVNSNGLLIMQRAIEWAEGAGTATTGPLAHWKLDETAGLTAVDSVGGHDGTLTNDPTWSTGQLDGALNFDGSNDYVNVPHDDTLSLTTFSISAWIRPAALSGWQIVVSKGNTTSWNYYLGINGSEISIGFNNSGSWTEFLTSGAGLATGQWYHLAGTFDDAAGEGKVYLNGALIHTGTTTASPSATSDAVMIGNSPAGEYWPGLLDDVRIYDRVLSDAEVAELATGGGDPPQTVLLVVGDATTLSSKDAGRKALIESWGHTVTVIDDGDSQANIDAATAAANVVYVTASIVGGTLANKLTGSTTAIVSEFSGKLDNLGFSSSTSATVLSDGFAQTDALHYITEPFSGNPVTVFHTYVYSMPVPSGTLAPDLQNVAEVLTTPTLVALETGATRYDGNPAPARRVHLPFGAAETDQLSADGETLMQRAIEWGAGAGAGGGGGGGGPTGVVFEEFTEAALSNGTSLAINKPAGTVTGDLLIAAVATDGNTAGSLAAPAGWNSIDLTTQGGAVTFGVWWKLAGASEGSNYTFSWSSSEHAYGWIMRFTGHDPASPVDANSNNAGSGTAATSPSVTTTVDNALILRLGGFDDDDITTGDPGLSGHTAINMGDSGNGPATASGGSGYVLQPTAGASGTASFSLTGSEQYVTVTLGIAPAP
jgi:hypothetical protein